MRNNNIPEPPPGPTFPTLREPLTIEGVREMVRLEWFETVCPICRGTPAGSSEAGTHTVTFFICPKCRAFSLTGQALEAMQTMSPDQRRRISDFSAAAPEPMAFDADLIASIATIDGPAA
jgi:Zn-finger nucleic acid-binding protein